MLIGPKNCVKIFFKKENFIENLNEKWRKMRNVPFVLLWHSVASGKQQEKYSLVSWVCKS